MAIDPVEVASDWLKALDAHLTSTDAAQGASLWTPDGWFRDVLAFEWDFRCQKGRPSIAAYLADRLPSRAPTNFRLDDRPFLQPAIVPMGPVSTVQAAFTFTTTVGNCRGLVTLIQSDNQQWQGDVVMMMLDELQGRPERGHESGLYDGHRLTWPEVDAKRRAEAEREPAALILGAGQTGLQIAARFQQMGIPYILLEKNHQVGDNWRKRYPTLTLHTTRTHHQFLYAPFPSTWPTFAPRDKLAQWMENYAIMQNLLVWTDSELLPTPIYDTSSQRWTAKVRRGSDEVILRPAHIIIATGVLGDLRIPQIPGADVFRGETMHASEFPGGEPFAGKRVVVIGAANTAADICQDAVNRGAAETWMVQRSSTIVVSTKYMAGFFNSVWPEGVPIDVLDFRVLGTPFFRLKEYLQTVAWPAALKHDATMHEGLEKAGFKLNNGPDGAGQLWAVYTVLGGYSMDVGCAQLIIDGQVKLKQGVEPVELKADRVVFSDGSEVGADAVIYATGYTSMRDGMRRVFGDSTIDRTSPVWNMDAEGELRGAYRPTGQPGLWFAAGDFAIARALSKQLGLQIQAQLAGII